MKKLERSLSLSAVVAIGIGGMLGGIFVLPGIAAAKTGASVWLAYLLAALCVFPATLSKAELATAMPTSGGTYVYIERAFGPLFGTISGIGLWIALLLKSAFALVGFGAYFLILVSFPLKPTALVFLFLVMILNILGAKKAGKVQTVIVALSVIGLGVLMLWGLPQVDSSNLEPFLSDGSSGLLAATAFLFVSYAGVTKIAAIAEEIKNPNRNLPIAIMLALGGATVIYVGISFVLVGNLPIEPLKTDITPLHTLAEHLGGYTFGIAVAIIGVGSLFSMVNAGILAAPRFLFAMSRDKLLPPALSKVHPKYLTPVFTIVFTCVIIGAVIIFLDVEKIAKLASAFKVAMFMAVHACVIVLRETGVQWYDPPYRSPLYPFTQIFGILSGLGLLIVLGLTPAVILITMFGLGAGIYWVYGRKAQRSGVLSQYGQRSAQYLLHNNNGSSSTGEITIKAAPKNLDGALSTTAKVVVPLFSKEKSPEILVEMGAALLESNKLQVVRLSEVPDQTMLDSMLDNAPVVQSLERRISAMADDHKLDVDF
ncbi:MAG: APC family permease, partial [Chitinophagales bacterium]